MTQEIVNPDDDDGPHNHHRCDLCPRHMICVTIDSSPSFLGGDDAKLKIVTSSIQKLISLIPTDTTYTIRSFSHLVDILVTRQKGKHGRKSQKQNPPGDMETILENGLKSNQMLGDDNNVPIRLYDGCAETIREIPVQNLKNDRIFILILSGSRDTGSGSDTLDSLIDLINDMMRADGDKENICLVFIQAGSLFKGLKALEEKCWFKKVHVIKVQDSAHKIPSAFKQAEQLLQSHFSPPFPCPSIQSYDSTVGTKNDQICSAPPNEENGTPPIPPMRRRTRQNSLADSPFKVLVCNIQPLEKLSNVEKTFSQFGRCRIDKSGLEKRRRRSSGGGNNNNSASSHWWPIWLQWLILSFETGEGMRVALSQNKKIFRQSHPLYIRRLNHQDYLDWIENKKLFKWPSVTATTSHGKSWWISFLLLCLSSSVLIGYIFYQNGGGSWGVGGMSQNPWLEYAEYSHMPFRTLGELQQFAMDYFDFYEEQELDLTSEKMSSTTRPLYEMDENDMISPERRAAIIDELNRKGYKMSGEDLMRILESMGGEVGVKSAIVFRDVDTTNRRDIENSSN